MVPSDHRFGFVALAGRPNVGKSTLVNRVMGVELAIVTPKAQTTRNRISAIYTTPDVQMVLQDTPGLHEPAGALNRSLVATALKAVEDADVILLVVEPKRKIHEQDAHAVDIIKTSKRPSVLAVNKTDTIKPAMLLPIIDAYSRMHDFAHIIPISALQGTAVDELVQALIGLLPIGPPLFPEDDVSDLPVRFFVAEIIREHVIRMTGEEIPYKTAVVVEAFKEERSRVLIQADVHTERESQKKILIGKGGSMIKKIGTAAREKIERFLGQSVRLELFVKVTPRWTRDSARLKEFGY